MNLLSRFSNATQFRDYDDFYNNFKLNVPDNFNYAYDVVDEYARLEPDKRALVWCDDMGGEEFFSFADIKRFSDKAANFFLGIGVGKAGAGGAVPVVAHAVAVGIGIISAAKRQGSGGRHRRCQRQGRYH